MNALLDRRLRALKSRLLVRAWDYRQRRHARGVWFRLRRVLAEASAAWTIPHDVADRLVAEGFQPEPAGLELAPPKVIVFAPADRIARIDGARSIAVRLSAELLQAEALALTRFGEDAPSDLPSRD
jgi:hypothetical protein